MKFTAFNKRFIWLTVAVLLVAWIVLSIALYYVFGKNPVGIDFSFHWNAGRAFFFEHLNPYGADVTLRNQLSVYGRAAAEQECHYAFSYPLYVLIPALPLFFFNFQWAHAIIVALSLLAVLSVGILFFPQAPRWIPMTLILFYEVYFTLIVANYALLVGLALLVIFEVLFFQERQHPRIDFMIGVVLSATTVKPQMVWLYVFLILLFSWRSRRWQVIYGFLSGFLSVMLVSLILQPTWPVDWVKNILVYSGDAGIAPTLVWYLSALIPQPTAVILYAALLPVMLAATGWLIRQWTRKMFPDLALIAWCGFVLNLFDPSSMSPDKFVLLIPFFLWAVHQPRSRLVTSAWALAILISNALFYLGLLKVIPSNAVDRWPLLFYTLWMVYLILKEAPGRLLRRIQVTI